MASGKVKWFDATKGYGFIQPDDGSQDVFVHVRAVEHAGLVSLPNGAKISYDLMLGRNGARAAEHLQIE
jgi:CspA family cold shock protein